MKKIFQQYRYIILAVLFLALSFLSFNLFDSSFIGKKQIDNFQQKLNEKAKTVDNIAQYVFEHPSDSIGRYFKYVEHSGIFQKKGIALYVYKDGKAVFWNTNRVKLPEKNAQNKTFQPVQLDNGLYLEKHFLKEDVEIVGYILIKNHFEYHNQYLEDAYFHDWGLNQDIKIKKKAGKEDIAVNNLSGETLFYLDYGSFHSVFFYLLRALLLFLSLVFLLFAFRHLWFSKLIKNQLYAFLSFATILLVLRWIMVNNLFPTAFYQLQLFSSTLYAQANIQPTLGDFLINVLLIFYLVFIFFSSVKVDLPEKKIYRQGTIILMYALPVIAAQLIAFLIQGLVVNSKIDFNLSNYLQLSVYGYFSLFIVAVMLLGFTLLADKVFNITGKAGFSFWREAAHISLSVVSLYALALIFFNKEDVLSTFWCFPVLLTLSFIKHKKNRRYSFGEMAILLVLFSGFLSLSLSKWTSSKINKQKKEIAQKLANDRDPIAEYVFASIGKDIEQDDFLKSRINQYWKKKKVIDKYIVDRYFKGFWNKYNIRITICTPNDSMIINPGNMLVNCRQYFQEQIDEGKQTATTSLYFVNGDKYAPIYIAALPFKQKTDSKNQTKHTAFIEFYPKYLNHAKGYPELLLDKEELSGTDISDRYDYAKYKNGELVSFRGDFNYPVSAQAFLQNNTKDVFHYIDFQDYYHLVYRMNDEVVVISTPNDNAMIFATMFSNIFALFSLFFFFAIVFFGRSTAFNVRRLFNNFNSKLQLFMLGIIFFAILLFGIGTAVYINHQYEKKNNNAISSKTRSILADLTNQLGDREELPDTLNNYFTYKLVGLSNVFYTDINLYGADGELIATSRPEIFRIGLLSDKLNSQAYKELQFLHKTEYIHKEQIGKLHYLAAYIPFYNQDGKFLAYLNVPYFGKQNELESEISTFLAALINIYVFLFLLSITIAFVFANFLSRPLRLIKEKIAGIRIGQTNELIDWEADDEIGALVSEYNRMVVMLKENIDLLAKTERESAWREMAKQVAHEIKNPLTPMKLSIQHLKRSSNDDSIDLKERIKKTADVLIQEIDILARIATEFSNFAQMPKAKKNRLLLAPLLRQSFDLYKESEGVDFIFHASEDEDLKVLVDKEHILRVFNNLIKNAIQAVEDDDKGKVEVGLKKEDNFVIITVKDNGPGIPEEQQENIFTPNFTTKSSGMGLGLAMAKNIVEISEGKIWFETKENVGTIFYVQLPLG